MKLINNTIKVLTSVLVVGGLAAGCSDSFIDRLPQDAIVSDNFYKTSEQVLAATAPLYNIVWFAYNDKASHGIGDARGGVFSANYSYQLENIQFRTTGATAENGTSWRAFFNVVGQSNAVISNINNFAGPEVPQNMKEHGIAEARFMRGLAYSYLVLNWGPVPIITDNVAVLQDTTIRRNTVESVWEFISRDLRYAAEHLPETPVQEGRLTKWSAEGMLAKMYLFRSGVGRTFGNRNTTYLDSARVLAKDVIDNSGHFLLDQDHGYANGYEELFKTKNNNNPETIFALQWVYSGDWGTQNSVQAYLAFSSQITGTPDGWGGDLGASMYMLSKYEGLMEDGETPDMRLKSTFMMPGEHYSYITQQVLDGDGNPVLQQLVVPTGGNGYNGRAWVKKYVVGRAEDNEGKVLQQRTEIQTYMLRMADVYLVYAEAILGNGSSTTDPEAVESYKKIRRRAGLDVSGVTSVTWADIFNERLVEFAMEGAAWYEWSRYHYFNSDAVYDSLSTQDRGFIRITPTDLDSQTGRATNWDIEPDPDYTGDRFFPVTSGNFRIPLPEAELSRAPNLRAEPVPYNFD